MGHYKSNLRDIEFNLFEVLRRQDVLGAEPYPDLDEETARGILDEVNRLATGPLAGRDEVARLTAQIRQAAGDRADLIEFSLPLFVVGDHAPPFADSTTEYFSPTQVPYAILDPR